MKFAIRLAIKEIKRNYVKLIIAIIVALILFMSAFTLCNLSAALPNNFYAHYEELYHQDLKITIDNADDILVGNAKNYFESVSFDLSQVFDKFYLLSNGKKFDYFYEENLNTTKYYSGEYVDVGSKDSKHNAIKNYLTAGEMWNDTSKTSDIWIADNVADFLGVAVGDIVTVQVEVYFETYDYPLNISGIYDFQKANEELNQGKYRYAPGIFYVTKSMANTIYLSSNSEYILTGMLPSVRELYDVYNELSKSYSIKSNLVMDMVIAVRNAEFICFIIGIFMLVGGLVVVMNFISMFISSNRKHIGLMRALGARSNKITMAYYLIYLLLIFSVCIICIAILPIFNVLLSTYCISVGYNFVISINWYVILILFVLSFLIMSFIMLHEMIKLNKIVPTSVLKEED